MRVIGMSRVRVASSAALSETARFGRRGSAASGESAGVMPDVETVTRRGGSTSKRIASAGRSPSRFRSGSPIPMKTTRSPSCVRPRSASTA